MKIEAVNPGFETRNVLTMAMSVSGDRFQTTGPVAQVIRDGRDRLMAIPGVEDAGVEQLPAAAGRIWNGLRCCGTPERQRAFYRRGGLLLCFVELLFNTFRIPLLRGRRFTEQDDGAAPGVVIINEAMAKRYWPNSDPLKDRIQIGPGAGPAFAEGHARSSALSATRMTKASIAIRLRSCSFRLRRCRIWRLRSIPALPLFGGLCAAHVDPHSLVTSISAALRDASGGLPVAHIRTMEELEARNTSRQRFNMLLLTIFGGAGLLMAAIGVYGIMSYSVQQRTQELGIRMALGAQASDLRSMVIGQGMAMALIGVVIGIGGAFWLTRFLASFLFGVKALDPVVFIATPVLLTVVALIAIWIPAERATRVDPMAALRLE